MNIYPELYDKSNNLQKKDSTFIYQRLKDDFENTQASVLVDIGCGTGNITKKMSELIDIGRVLGVDSSETMIKYAGETYGTENLGFKVADICDDWEKLSQDLGIAAGSVDIVTSTYCLHWISDFNKAMNNIYTMLKPGGKCYLLMFSWSQILPLQEQITYHPRWAELFRKHLEGEAPKQTKIKPGQARQGRRRSSAPFPVFEIPPEEHRIQFWTDLCNASKLASIDVQVHNSTFTYDDIEGFRGELQSLCHYLIYIPEEQRKQFMDDYFEHMDNCFITRQENLPKVKVDYQFLTVTATKPKDVE